MIKKIILFAFIPILMFFSFQPINLWFLFIPAYTGILFLLRDMNLKKKFLYAITVFTIFFVISMHWLLVINVQFSVMTRILIGFGFIVLSICQALLWITPIMLINLKSREIYFLPIFFAALEFIVSIENNTAFIWLSPAHTMLSFLPLAQIADIGGMYLVTAFTLFIAVLLIRIAVRPKREKWFNAIILLIALSLTLLYGYIRMNQQYGSREVKIAVVQPNVPAEVKEQFYDGTEQRIRIIESFFRAAECSDAELIIFPETSSPVYLQRNNEFSRYVADFSERTGMHVLMGSLRVKYNREKQYFDYYNSAYYYSGAKKDYYNKIRPLGFAERMPFDDRFRFIKNIPLGQGDLTPGREYKLFSVNGVNFASYICFESVFAPIAARFVRDGAEFLVNISEDAWFIHSVGAYQHFYAGVYRSIENRRYLVRSSNPGISAIITPTGIIEQKLNLHDEGIIMGTIKANESLTFYTKFDNILCKLFSLVLMIFISIKIIRRINERYKSKNRT